MAEMPACGSVHPFNTHHTAIEQSFQGDCRSWGLTVRGRPTNKHLMYAMHQSIPQREVG
jgi:hypothetical protein